MKRNRIKDQKAYLLLICLFQCILVIAVCLYPATADATTPPTLDGAVDPEYYQYGMIGDYFGLTAGASARLYVIDNTAIDPNYVWLAWVVAKTFNDISYGANQHSSWTKGHSFSSLELSDKQQVQIFNACKEMVVDATMDLLDGPGYTTPSGYDASMTASESVQNYINGGSWSTADFDYKTSFAYDLNYTGYCTGGTCGCGGTNLLVDSPNWLDEPNYVPVASCSNWIYEAIWEMKVARSVLVTGGCPQGGVDIPSILEPIELHASPSKTGNNIEGMYLAASSIGDTIWLDRDRDGIYDIGEPGIANVTLELWSDPNGDGDTSDGAPIFTTTTNTDGKYLFPSLAAVSYVVKVTDDYGVLSDYTLTSGAVAEDAKTLAVDEKYWDADFGYAPADTANAVIGDFVWSDADNDGIQDPGEPGIGGVTLELRRVSDNQLMDTVTTDANGAYMFGSVAPGTYYVEVTDTGSVLTGYTLTSGPQSSGSPTAPITVQAGDIYLNADFGYFQAGLGTIGNQIWIDLDEDGYFDGGDEKGIPNVVVDLIQDTNGNGTWDAGEPVIASTYTASDGTYSFNGLDLDDGDGDFDYIVNVSDTNYLLSRLYHQKFGTVGADNNGQRDPYAIALSAGTSSNQTADFAYMLYLTDYRGVVGDTVWYDKNNNNVQDAGEEGIADVTLELWTMKHGSPDKFLGTTTTDANGFYYFSQLNVKNGGTQYAVKVAASNFAPGGPLNGLAGTNQPDNQDESDTLKPQVNQNIDMTLDFGYWFSPPGSYTLGDRVWLDTDADGFQDAGETGISGVTLKLYWDKDGDGFVDLGEPSIGSTTTGGDGLYQFTDLPNNDYIVVVTDEAGVLQNYTLTSGLDQYPITISGASRDDADFGYINTPATGSIGDYVWLDADRDGNQDVTEQGISGVTLNLYSLGPDNAIGGGDDVLEGTTTTDAAGKYLFPGLSAGRYYVDVADATVPSGLAITTGSTDPTGVISLSEGQNYRDADFGYGPDSFSGVIGDFVWSDADNDGMQDPGEIGIGGVTIELRRSSDGALIDTATTAADGSYLFTNVAPGTYYVDVTDTGGVLSGYTLTVGPQSKTDPTSDIPLAAGGAYLSADFGYYNAGLGSIGDTIYYDFDEDGTQDAGEPGIQDVTLGLYTDPNGDGDPADGVLLFTTFTDSSGGYSFTGLTAGDYVVVVTDTNNVLSSYNPTGDPDETGRCVVCNERGSSTLSPGSMDDDTVDFGYNTAFGTIGNYLWYDLDGDGFADPGEGGIEGVTVALWLDNDPSDSGITEGVDNYLRTVTTDENGLYQFTGLFPGDYLVQVTDTNGVLTGYNKTTGTAGLDNNSQANPYKVQLTETSLVNLTADFGYYTEPAAAYSIGNLVWLDDDADGFKDASESGIDGVTIVLYNDMDGDGTIDPEDPIVRQTITASGGAYLFDNLPAGDYIVDVTDDYNVLASYVHTTSTNPGDGYSKDIPYAVGGLSADVVYADFGFAPEEATVVVIGAFGAYDDGGTVVVRWQTVSEMGTIGFYLYRLNENSGRFHRLNSKMLPGLLHSPTGGWYSYRDTGAKPGRNYTYRLDEVEARGRINTYGPWVVDTSTPLPPLEAPVTMEPLPSMAGFSAAARPISVKKLARMEAKAKSRLKGMAARLEIQGNQAKIAVSEDGIYFIGVDEMVRVLGLSAEDAANRIGSDQVRLRLKDQLVAVLPAADNSGLYFYGQGVHDSVYTNDNVYRLDINNGRLMSTAKRRTGKPADDNQYFNDLVLAEEDHYQLTTILTDLQKDYWFWDWIYPGVKDTISVTVPTHGIVDNNAAVLTVTLQGASDAPATPDHHAVIRLNGTKVAESHWGGITEKVITIPDISTDLLNDGDNTVEIKGITDSGVSYSIFYLNRIRIDYPRYFTAADNRLAAKNNGDRVITINGFTSPDIHVFDISDPVNPVVLSNLLVRPDPAAPGQYRVSFKTGGSDEHYFAVTPDAVPASTLLADEPSSLKDHSNRANYLIITAGYMKDAAQVLADYRAAQGLLPMVVDIEDIYDEFSYGIKDVPAIRSFLSYAYSNWLVAPKYVLMAGDGSFDYKDNMGYGDAIVPGMLVETPEGLFITDNYFADVNGGDMVPEFVVGRIPVIDADELSGYIQKVIRYEASGGDWENKVMLAADKPDDGGDFTAGSNAVAEIIPPSVLRDFIHLDVMDIGPARSEFISRINQGRAFVNFIGHGSPNLIGDQDLFSISSMSQLHNADKMPVFTAMTCLAGNFGYPGFDRLNEALVLPAFGGAVAMWSPSGYAFNSHSVELCKGFYSARYITGERVIGDAIFSAQQAFAAKGAYLYYLYLYNLIGDPALVMK